jgi:hypothetical protein
MTAILVIASGTSRTFEELLVGDARVDARS